MKGRKLLFTFLFLAFAVGLVYIYIDGFKDEVFQNGTDIPVADQQVIATPGVKETPQSESIDVEFEPAVIAVIDIPVINNSLEYDLKASLNKLSSRDAYMKLEYYLDGQSTSAELGSENITEVAEAFDNDDEAGKKGYRVNIDKVYLNPVNSRAYFFITKKYLNGLLDFRLLCFNLREPGVKELLEAAGAELITGMTLNADYSHAAFNYKKANAPGQHLIDYAQIVNCQNDMFILKENCNQEGNNISDEKDREGTSDGYYFMAWKSNTEALLIKTAYKMDLGEQVQAEAKQEEIFDVISGKLLRREEKKPEKSNPPATPVSTPGAEPVDDAPEVEDGGEEPTDVDVETSSDSGEDTEGSKHETQTEDMEGSTQETQAEDIPEESEPVAVLKEFYMYLSDESRYSQGISMLDENFKLELDMFKQFGFDYMTKAAIDVEAVSMYKSLLMMARLEYIEKEEVSDNISTIYFTQSFAGQGNMDLTATLKKTDKGWSILSIKEIDVIDQG